MVLVVLVGRMQGVWGVVALLSLATAADQVWSANRFTLATDMFPRRAVGSVMGLGTSGAALLMAFISTFSRTRAEIDKRQLRTAVRGVWHRLSYGSLGLHFSRRI